MTAPDTGLAMKHLHEAVTRERAGDYERALRAAQEALSGFATARDRTGSAAAHHLLAILHAHVGRPDKALEHLDAAAPLRESTGDWAGLASLHQMRFEVALGLGNYSGCRAAAESMLAALSKVGDRSGQASALHQLAQILVGSGQVQDAQSLVEQGLWLTDGVGEERGRSAFLLLAAQVDQLTGSSDRALLRCREALRLARSANSRPAVVDALHQLGVQLAVAGRLDESAERLEEALDGREVLRDLNGRGATLTELAAVEERLGRLGDAIGRLRYAARTYHELDQPSGALEALHRAAEIALAANRGDEALQLSSEQLHVAETSGDPAATAAASFVHGARLARLGQTAASAEPFRRAAALQRSLGLPEAAAVSDGMLGQVLLAEGQVNEGAALLQGAYKTLRAMGSPNADDLHELISALGEPS
ncbi:hypothetical protein L6R46_16295 [Myxococcota bacterium]|nr:hypothetical protein [Myxococcota bacterium]